MSANAAAQPALYDALRQIDGWIGPRGVGGAAVAVWYRGELVAERQAGDARVGIPVEPDTLFGLASITKPIAATTVMSLVEEGRLALDQSVAGLLPEFAAGPTTGVASNPDVESLRPLITVRHLLCHTSGLPEDLASRESRYRDRLDLEAMTDAMCRLPLQSAPGETLRYSNAGYAILARIAERVGHQPFWELTRDRVLDPLGLSDIVAEPGHDLEPRLAWLQDAHHPGTEYETYNSAYWRTLALPWGGLYGTVSDVARFAGSFLRGQTGDDPLAPATRAAMIVDQTGGVPGGVESGKIHWPVGRWGLGWEVKGEKERHWTGMRASPRTFCHFGQAGTLVWGDPDRDLALAVFTNRAVSRVWGFFLTRWTRLSDAVVEAVDG